MLEKVLESPLDCKEIQPVHPKGDQSWVFIGRTAAEAETPIIWPPDVKSWLTWKDPDAGNGWEQKEKGTTRMRWLDGITDLMESEKGDLKINIQKTKIMASSPITSWEIDGETVEKVTDFIFLVSKITADGDCSHEFKRCLLLERKLWPT